MFVPIDGPALQLVADAYGLGKVVRWTAAAQGTAGAVYRLMAASGVYAAKEFISQRPNDGDLQRRAEFATICRVAGVPNPETLLTNDGLPLFMHPGSDRPWLVQRWVNGVVPERTDVPASLWLARQAAVIHGLAVPCKPNETLLSFFIHVEGGWAEAASTARRVGGGWARCLGKRVSEFERLTELVNSVPIRELITCHRDLKVTNTLCATDGRRCLLDWDSCGPQEAWRELGTLLLHHVGNDDAVAAIAAEYRRAGPDSWPGDISGFATGLAVWLNVLRGQIQAMLDPTHAGDRRGSSEQRLVDFINGIPDTAALTKAAEIAAASARQLARQPCRWRTALGPGRRC